MNPDNAQKSHEACHKVHVSLIHPLLEYKNKPFIGRCGGTSETLNPPTFLGTFGGNKSLCPLNSLQYIGSVSPQSGDGDGALSLPALTTVSY